MNIAAGRPEPHVDEEKKEPWHLTIPDVKDVIVGELAERGEWIVANIQTGSFWPVNAQKVQYRGETFYQWCASHIGLYAVCGPTPNQCVQRRIQ